MSFSIDEIRRFGNIELLARQLVEGFITGLHKSPYHGFSVEFAEHKLYNNGESTRHIDWKAYAKTDRLYTKKYEEETNLRCQLIIDSSSSMNYPLKSKGKLTFSIMAAASIAYLLHKQRDAVGLTTFSDKLEIQTQVKSSSSHFRKLLINLKELLHENTSNKKTNVASMLHGIAKKIHKRSLVVIFSDMFSNGNQEGLKEIFSALQHLKHNKHEVLLFHVTDPSTEKNFEFIDRPHEFIDLETGEKTKVQPSFIKDDYTKHMSRFYKEIVLNCGQLKIDFVEADIQKGYDTILKAYLIKRAKMR